MRLFLLPISTRRTLLYCQRPNVAATGTPNWVDKATTKAADMWAGWEKKESGWQKKLVDYGNMGLKRIPFEEWGLKSIPPLNATRQEEASAGKKVEVSFPETLLPGSTIKDLLTKLSTERQQFHRRNLIWSVVGMPLVAPFALVPVIPNIPFFYLVFRAWSHWRAWSGSKHLQLLVNNGNITPTPSKILDELYATGKMQFDASSMSSLKAPSKDAVDIEEKMVLHTSDGKRLAGTLEVPELDMELDRAVWQVERALKAKEELKEEKTDLDSANAEPLKDKK